MDRIITDVTTLADVRRSVYRSSPEEIGHAAAEIVVWDSCASSGSPALQHCKSLNHEAAIAPGVALQVAGCASGPQGLLTGRNGRAKRWGRV